MWSAILRIADSTTDLLPQAVRSPRNRRIQHWTHWMVYDLTKPTLPLNSAAHPAAAGTEVDIDKELAAAAALTAYERDVLGVPRIEWAA